MSSILRGSDAAAACRGKHRFDSPGQANAVLRSMTHRRGAKGDRGIFRCPHCAGWHLTQLRRTQAAKRWKQERRGG